MPTSLPVTFYPNGSASTNASHAPGTSASRLFKWFTTDDTESDKRAKLTRTVKVLNTEVNVDISVDLGEALVYLVSLEWGPSSGARVDLNLQVTIPLGSAKSSVCGDGHTSEPKFSKFEIDPDNFSDGNEERPFADKVQRTLWTARGLWFDALIAHDTWWQSDPIMEEMRKFVNGLLMDDLVDAWKSCA
jgi:hypothetical protein